MQLIETKTLGTAGSSISFADIPQTFTDLLVVFSLRGDQNANNGFTNIGFNSSTSNFSTRFLQGDGSGVASSTGTRGIAYLSNAFYTSNTFDSTNVYIPNYTGATNKSFSAESVVENNATLGWQFMVAGLWSNTAAITSIQITPNTGNFIAGSTISLYGIGGAGDGYAPKATGGAISFVNGYWTHVFTASGTFTPTANIASAECLVIGGGGGGGFSGAGAGGYRELSQSLSSGVAYAVTVGAGGSANTSGSPSIIGSIQSAGGGTQNSSGGSGGGGTNNQPGGAGNTPSTTPSQGSNGGAGAVSAGLITGGGGGAGGSGGAGASGLGAPLYSKAGNGGSGATSSITGTAVTRAGGGGGGNLDNGTPGSAGTGGSGGGGNGTRSGEFSPAGSGTVNTGSGGGGIGQSGQTPGSGGSGIVVVRYAA